MRWIFIGVVVLNLGYLIWHFQSQTGAAETPRLGSLEGAAEFPQKLRLVGEPGAAGGEPMVAEPGAPVITGCPAIGPLNESDASSVASRLADRGFPAAVRQVDVPASSVFWVYLPPAETREAALRKLRELHARSIDSFVVSDGEFARAISLGSFQSRASAVGVQTRFNAAGYQAEIREQIKDVRQAWVVLSEPAAQGFLEPIPADIARGVRVERLACGAR